MRHTVAVMSSELESSSRRYGQSGLVSNVECGRSVFNVEFKRSEIGSWLIPLEAIETNHEDVASTLLFIPIVNY